LYACETVVVFVINLIINYNSNLNKLSITY